METSKKWYDNNVLVNVLLFVLYPVDLFALWKSKTIAKWWKFGGTAVILVLIAASTNNKQPSQIQTSTQEVKTEEFAQGNPIKVTKAEYGKKWPFTINEGYIDCIGYQEVVFKTNQGIYALNETAKDTKDWKGDKLWKDIDEIWAIDEVRTKDSMKSGLSREKAITRIPMPDFIGQGLKLCK